MFLREHIPVLFSCNSKYYQLAIFSCISLLVVFFLQFNNILNPSYYLLSQVDNIDLYVPLLKYFDDLLANNYIAYYNPFLWCGARLIGDPNLQLSIFHLTVAYFLSFESLLFFYGAWHVFEYTMALAGYFILLSRLIPSLSIIVRGILSISYVCSFGFIIANVFPSTGFHFVAIPWILSILYWYFDTNNKKFLLLFIIIFSVQLSWGQLQFSLYSCWLYFFVTIYLAYNKSRLNLLLALTGAVIISVAMAAYYLVPMFDTVFISGTVPQNRIAPDQFINYQKVPFYYVIRLISPAIFGHYNNILTDVYIPWWPKWSDGFSLWESYSGYQSILITALAFFSIFIRNVPILWKFIYLFIIFTPFSKYGVYILKIINLGSQAPYGRITILIVFVAPLLCGYALLQLSKNKRCLYSFLLFSFIFLMIGTYIAQNEWLIIKLIEMANQGIATSKTVSSFLANNLHNIMTEINSTMMTFYFAFIALILIVAGKLNFLNYHMSVAAKGVGIFVLMLVFAINMFSNMQISPSVISYARVYARDILHFQQPSHPLAATLSSKTFNGSIIINRVDIDIPFGLQRCNIPQGKASEKNAADLLPNRTMFSRIPITSGYNSLVPHGDYMGKWFSWHQGAGSPFRAVGDFQSLNHSLFSIMGIKYILRADEDRVSLQGFKRKNKTFENFLLKTSDIIATTQAYKLYEYKRSNEVGYFPTYLVQTAQFISGANIFNKMITSNQISHGSVAFIDEPINNIDFDTIVSNNDFKISHKNSRSNIFSVKGDSSKKIVYKLHSDKETIFVPGIKNDPWWKIRVNNKSTNPFIVNGFMSGVLIPAGDSIVELTLSATSAVIGIWLSVIAYLLLFTLLIFLACRKQWTEHLSSHKQKTPLVRIKKDSPGKCRG